MDILVKKFGGTSLSCRTNMDKVCDIIKKDIKLNKLVIVISAMGRYKSPYATDTLLSHYEKGEGDYDKRTLDILMSCGEIISGSIFTSVLQSYGIDSVFLTGGQAGIRTNNNYTESTILDINTKRIKSELSKGKVVVVAGFQGETKDGEITTLGRGGSDISAVALGKALKCEEVDIFTDVDGIMTVDPKVDPNAILIENISYDDAYNMAVNGAKVIHPRAVEYAKDSNIKLKIKNTFNTGNIGTVISGDLAKEII